MDEPIILKFPALADASCGPACRRPISSICKRFWPPGTKRPTACSRRTKRCGAEVRRLSDELEAKNRELARKNRLADLGQMASHVAHEVRNSLVPMKLYLSLLRRRIDDDRGSLDVLDKVMAGFTALEATVGDLLHFSSQRDRPPATRSHVARLLGRRAAIARRRSLRAQGIRAEIDCPHGLTAHGRRRHAAAGHAQPGAQRPRRVARLAASWSLTACRTPAGPGNRSRRQRAGRSRAAARSAVRAVLHDQGQRHRAWAWRLSSESPPPTAAGPRSPTAPKGAPPSRSIIPQSHQFLEKAA